MNTILNIYKPPGFTPLELIQTLRNEKPELGEITIGYAGRLDPLAHGVMLLMLGETTKEREKYLGLPKTYEFEVLFGIETDTYDVLGLGKNVKPALLVNEKVSLFVKNHLGKYKQSYPPYSSKAVAGKPLFWWARNNRLSEIEIPTKVVEVFTFNIVSQGVITGDDLEKKVWNTISSVNGDFRQSEIRAQWEKIFAEKTASYQTAAFRIECSSGTYVRGLAHELGRALGTGAIALAIKRTKVGDFTLSSSLKLKTITQPHHNR